MEKVYVIGHINPDTDTVASAVALAELLNKKEKTDRYVPVMTGKANTETEFVFNRFGVKLPEVLENAQGKKLFLVDHNESSQIVRGHDVEDIMGFVDHHKIKFENSKAIYVICKPWGSSSSVIYSMYQHDGIKPERSTTGLMLCAMLSDTVILKSPTTTDIDKRFVEELSKELNEDYKTLGLEQFKAKAQVSKKTAKEIIMNDFKEYMFPSGPIGVGQIEMPDLSEIESKLPEIIRELNSLPKFNALIIMLTDVIKEGTRLIVVSKDEDKIAKIFKTKITNNVSEFIPGMMSRKKQVAPLLTDNF